MTTRSRTSHNWTRLNELRSTIAYSSRFVEANLLKQFLVPERSMLSWDKSTVKGNASIRNHNITFQNTPLKAYILRNPWVCIASVALCDQMFCSDPSPRWLLFCWIMCFKGANQSTAFWVPPCNAHVQWWRYPGGEIPSLTSFGHGVIGESSIVKPLCEKESRSTPESKGYLECKVFAQRTSDLIILPYFQWECIPSQGDIFCVSNENIFLFGNETDFILK